MEKVNRADKNVGRGGQASHSVCEEKRCKGKKTRRSHKSCIVLSSEELSSVASRNKVINVSSTDDPPSRTPL